MTTAPGTRLGWDVIVAQLPGNWRELAVDMKLVQPRPQQLGAKVTDIEQVLRPVLHHVTGASLRLTTATSMAAGLISLSAVALHKWMRKLGPYLAELLMRLLGTEQLSPERWAGYRLPHCSWHLACVSTCWISSSQSCQA